MAMQGRTQYIAVKGRTGHPAEAPSSATNPFVLASATFLMGRRAGSGRRIGVFHPPTAAEPRGHLFLSGFVTRGAAASVTCTRQDTLTTAAALKCEAIKLLTCLRWYMHAQCLSRLASTGHNQ